ncbi:MAG TPA: wax ester/triacylglycerol synthase family O-acyltransferase [Rubrivivax sp.]
MSMKQLSGLDATFLYLETPEMPMHVGALHLIELPAGYKGRFVTNLRKHIASRLGVAPVLRRKLWWMPLNLANPAWVDAEPVLNQHIVEIRLPATAKNGDGLAVLEAQVGALHPVLLDRKRPLWKMHVFEGLAPAANGHKRVALYTQLHHAAVDGQAAVALANAILDLTPAPRAVEARASRRQKVFRLEMTEMLRGALGNQVAQVTRIVKDLPATLGTLGGAARTALGKSALLGGKQGVSNVTLAPNTPFNVSVTARRSFAAVSLPLRELKALGRAHDATVNDMVLMVCSTALRRYFGRKHTLPKKSLVAAVPITLREAGDTSPDNQASMSLISLGTHIADAQKRLAHIRAATAAMKSTMGSVKSILPTDFPSIGMPWLIEAATALYGKARVADKIPQVANVVISNVPGPPVPLYIAGALMLTNYPTSIVVHGLALNITVQSYDQSLDFGLIADAAAVSDVKMIAEAIAIAFDDLRALPLAHEQAADLGGLASQLMGQATKRVTGAMGAVLPKMAKGLVDAAVDQAVAQVTRRPSVRAAAKKKRTR